MSYQISSVSEKSDKKRSLYDACHFDWKEKSAKNPILQANPWIHSFRDKTQLFMSKIYTLLFLLACAWHTTAQITGTVTDASGFELPGVTVQVVGANTGTVTDINGQYSIQVNGEWQTFSNARAASKSLSLKTISLQFQSSPSVFFIDPFCRKHSSR